MEPNNKQHSELLSTILAQNKSLIEQNHAIKALLEQSTNKLQQEVEALKAQNVRQTEENSKIYTHFTTEFFQLKMTVENAMKAVQMKGSVFSVEQLCSPEEVLDFERRLKDNCELKNKLIQRIKAQPHDDIRKFVQENVKLVFQTDEIITRFSWNSANRNIPVKDMHYIKLIRDTAIDHIPGTAASTIEFHIKNFFNSAKDRQNKRKRKAESKKSQSDKSESEKSES
ncbi:uncharacterized protein LOC133331060 isoform X2 [Musca vetustissima]|uniref:uncharacterized protein LOC133331060 isoform X2 n=1 Tax=Musca vetustissima TaxID=27455 RepID=UPI002AB7A060|nr:uncharacterized protein LOC133331060 isoform X2 [Musca vetustissima]